MTHICISKLTIIGPDYLNQWWNIVNWTLGNKLQWNLNRNLNIFIQKNAIENVVWKMAAILPGPQCVNKQSFSRPHPWRPLNQWLCYICWVVSELFHNEPNFIQHYNDVIMGAMASQITSLTISLLNRLFRPRSKKTSKHCVTGLWQKIQGWPVNSLHKWPVMWKMFPFDDIMQAAYFWDNYRQVSNISRTLVGNKIVDNSDAVGASPVGAAPTTSSLST